MADPVVCAWCGRSPDPPEQVPVTWSMQTSARGVERICEDCIRANLRSVEGKLDTGWW